MAFGPFGRRFTGPALLGLVGLAALRTDDDFATELLSRFRAYQQQRPVEKVYVRTDRDLYAAGETIWLAGSLFNGTNHSADTVSRVLYVELIEAAAGRVRLRALLRATGGHAPGQLGLPDTLSAGTYQLRAYTNYMRNAPDAYFFTKPLRIVRPDGAPDEADSAPMPAAGNWPDVQFLPEGGSLVTGLESRVAFKATAPSGQGVVVDGFVLNARQDTVTGFQSAHLGMGYFILRPEAGQTYTAFVRLANKTTAAYPLPAAQPQGVVMQVDNLTNKDNIQVYLRHNKTVTDTSARLTLLAQTRGRVIQLVRLPLTKKGATVQLPRADFPEGIAQLTLFDETHRPVAERLVFVNHDHRIRVTLTPTRRTYRPRERVEFDVTTTTADGKPVSAQLSLAAVDERVLPADDSLRADLVAHLLLGSDLTGTLEQPGYYFDPAHADRFRNLDLLLLTQGWRRFAWTDVLTGTLPPLRYPVEQGLSLTGQVRRPNQKETGGPVRLTFIMARRDSTGTASRRDFLAGQTDERGNYGAYDLDFTDTTTVLIQAVRDKANRDLVITLDQLLTPTVTLTRVPYNPLTFRSNELSEFARRTNGYLAIERQIRRNREVLLKAVTVRGQRPVERDTRILYNRADATVKFDPLNTAGKLTVLDVIQSRVPGVQVTGFGLNAVVQIRGAANFRGIVEPLFLVDGIPMDKQGVFSLSVEQVDRVDILKGASTAIYGSSGGGGVISILTKRGMPNYDLNREAAPGEASRGTLIAELPGYAPVREFYAPRYDTKPAGAETPDYRTTLFWAPAVRTDAGGKAHVSFFAADARTTVRIRAESATFDGRPGTGQTTVRVE